MNESKPHLKARKEVELNLSPIWFLPILAVVISAWLLVKMNLESKVPITIEMSTAQGIVPGKTQIKFRGINAGIVSRVEVSENLSHVTIHADIEPHLAEFLTTETKFWVVRAQISLAGVSGLDTVLSGDYIAFTPGRTGEAKRSFRALNSAPPIADDDPGLRITLTSENLGSISEGSQLYYRQIPIGEVRFYELSNDTRTVNISALINPEYSHLVNMSTVFWNSGGVRLKGSLSGFEVRTESLAAILAGGISLFTPDPEADLVDINDRFTLHESYDDAGVGVPVKIAFPSGYDLQSGITKVKFHGINVGHLDSINVSPGDDSGVIANVIIDPGAEPLLVEDTEFWLVKPDLSFKSLSNLETLISGNYITMKSGDSMNSAREFAALDGPPPPDFQDPGLHVFLKANQMGSIAMDTPVLFKGVEVGRVANVFINDLAEGVGFHLHIRPEYDHLINETSRFWNASGLDIAAGLGGIQIRSSSLMNIIRGGIEFETPDSTAKPIEDGHEFQLLDNPLSSEDPLKVAIQIDSADSFQPDVTSVRYKGMGIGVLKRLEYRHESDRMYAHFEMNRAYEDLFVEDTIFWLVTPTLSAAKVHGLDSLFTGPYLTLKPGQGNKTQTKYALSAEPAAVSATDPGLLLELKAETALSLQQGSPVYHKEIEVGSVQSVRLDETGVSIMIHILQKYEHLVSDSTRFWSVSGIEVQASLGGVKVSTGSLTSMLAGGIAFDSSHPVQNLRQITDGEQFKLYASKSSAQLAGSMIRLIDTEATGVGLGATIRFKGLVIGEVIHQRLTENDHIELTANIHNNYQELLTSGSVFWLAKAKLGLLKQENLGQLLSGPEIRIERGAGERQTDYVLQQHAPVIKAKSTGLNLVLEAAKLGSVKPGVGIYYRQVEIGQVTGVQLGQSADRVQIFINIDSKYEAVIRTNSVFWNASGIQLSAGLFSGVDVKTDAIESILAGGIAVATPEELGAPGQNGDVYELRDEFDSDWLEWQPRIDLGN